jgi:[ribosomal protein S5]-alanine N-acetyltransferase
MNSNPFITERLVLRPLEMSDAPSLFKLDSDPLVMKYLGNKPLTDIAQVYSYLENILFQYQSNGIGRWAVIEKSTGDLIGWSGIKLIHEETNGFKEFHDLGYRLRPEFWGKGYATESSQAWIEAAEPSFNINKLYASAHVENTASQNVLRKVGFKIKGTYDFLLNGVLIPCYWMEL